MENVCSLNNKYGIRTHNIRRGGEFQVEIPWYLSRFQKEEAITPVHQKPNVLFPSTAYNPAKNTVMRSFAIISVA
jgi:hypothetical protein